MTIVREPEQREWAAEHVYRVLVVEDNPDLRILLADAFTDAGFEIRTVANGKEALALADDWHPDAIVLDLMMPVMDGPTFLRRRRTSPSLRDAPVLVLTAHAGHQLALDGLDVTVVLRKPYDLYELLDAVSALCAAETGRGQAC